MREIDTRDFLRLVVSAHLYIEAVLIKLINEKPQSPSPSHIAKLGFMQIVDLAVRVDALPTRERRPLLLLDRMRNRLTHELGATITMGEVEDCLNALTPEQLHFVGALTRRPIAYGIDLQPALVVLFVGLHRRLLGA